MTDTQAVEEKYESAVGKLIKDVSNTLAGMNTPPYYMDALEWSQYLKGEFKIYLGAKVTK